MQTESDTGEPKSPEQTHLKITVNGDSDPQTIIGKIDLLIAEADIYLQQWQTKLGLPALTQPDAEIELRDPIWEWTSQAIDHFFQWYTTEILPSRNRNGMKSVRAHGTYFRHLFKDPQKKAGWQGVADSEGVQGIISTGRVVGQFGIFEEYDHRDFSKGAWFCRGPGIIQRMSHDCWILIDDENAREQQIYGERHKLNSLALVFVDPRTYREYLKELRRNIKNGEEITPHTAMRLDQLQDHLQNHQGKFPFEETKGIF